MRTSRTSGAMPPGMPVLDDWMKKLVGGLFALWMVEILANLAGLPTELLPLYGQLGWLLAPWSLVTRYLVQGTSTQSVTGVLFGLLFLYFLLPAVARSLTRRQLAEAVLAGAVGGTVVVLLSDVLVNLTGLQLATSYDGSWRPLLVGLVVLFGISNPQAEILLYFVLPVRASWFLWGSLAYGILLVLTASSSGENVLGALDHVGVWLGTYGWWFWRGPGGRRRHLKRQARTVERELTRLKVLPGGRDQTWHRDGSAPQRTPDGILGT